MADIETLRLFVNERLSAVAEDILAAFVRTLVQYQQHMELQQQQQQQQIITQLDMINTPSEAHVSGL